MILKASASLAPMAGMFGALFPVFKRSESRHRSAPSGSGQPGGRSCPKAPPFRGATPGRGAIAGFSRRS
jgi:hypothetical protein